MTARMLTLFFFFVAGEEEKKMDLILPSCYIATYAISVFNVVYGILKNKPNFLIPFFSLEVLNFITHAAVFIHSVINLKFYRNLSYRVLLKDIINKSIYDDHWTFIFCIYVTSSIIILFFELYLINLVIYCHRYLSIVPSPPTIIVPSFPPKYTDIIIDIPPPYDISPPPY